MMCTSTSSSVLQCVYNVTLQLPESAVSAALLGIAQRDAQSNTGAFTGDGADLRGRGRRSFAGNSLAFIYTYP